MTDGDFDLRAYVHLDRLQPQFAAFAGAVSDGAPPVEGMSSLYVEMAPGNWIYRIVDKALKTCEVYPGAQMVEREYGMLEVHSASQADVLRVGEIVLETLGLTMADRSRPRLMSDHIIRNVDPYQAQIMNRTNKGTMVVAGQTMMVLEVQPAAYITLAANEAEKTSPVFLNQLDCVGMYGRVWMSGTESDVLAAHSAAIAAIEEIQRA